MSVEDTDIKRKRLIFRSWHRGTREMDLILGSFADRNVPGFDEAALSAYEDILENTDPDLYNWYTGQAPLPANLTSAVFEKLLTHKISDGKSRA